MKKIIIMFLGIICLFTGFSSQAFASYTYPNGGIAKAGDILVTSDTVSFGLAGHAAIVVDGDTYMETRGPGHYPTLYPLSDWFSMRSTMKIIRINDSQKAASAGQFASFFDGSGIPYKITGYLLDNTYIYCSKLVYQSYALSVPGVFPILEEQGYMWPPYNFLQKELYLDVIPSVVYQKGMLLKGNI